MNLGLVALKIRNASTRFGNRVVGAAELALAQEYTLKDETAFVVPLTEAATPNQNDTWVNQLIKENFGVIVALKNDKATTDKLGFKALDLHADVRAELLTALLGWTMPSASAELVCYAGGRLVDVNPAWLWYMYEFTMVTRITSDEDGVDPALTAAFTDLFMKVFTQWKIDGDPVLPLTGDAPQLPTKLLTPTVEELFGPEYSFDKGFSTGENTLDAAAE